MVQVSVEHRAVKEEKPFGAGRSEIPLDGAVAFVGRWWRVILLAGLVAAVTGVLVATVQPVLYEGVATVAVSQPRFTADAKPIAVSNFKTLLETNVLAASAIARFQLDREPYRLTPGRLLRDGLIVEEVRNTNFIRVRARFPERKMAADLANFIAEQALALNERMDLQETKDFRGQLRTQLDEATLRLRTTEEDLLAYRKISQFDLLKRDADSALTERGEILRLTLDIESEKAKLAAAQGEIQKQQRIFNVPRMVGADMALFQSTRDDAQTAKESQTPRDPQTVRDPKTPGAPETASNRQSKPDAPREGRADARATDIDLTNPFVNPVYQVLDYQIALSRTRLASLEQRRRELVGVQGLGGKELQALTSLYPQEIKLDRLQAEHDLAKSLYSEIALQYERVRLQIASSSARLQVIDRAIEPDAPLPRHRGLYGLMGLIGGCIAAALVLALRTAVSLVG